MVSGYCLNWSKLSTLSKRLCCSPFSMTTTSEIKEVNDIYFLAGMFHHLWQVDTFLAGEINFKDDCHQVSLSVFGGHSSHQG